MEEFTAQLLALKPTLIGDGSRSLSLFDEFVEQREFALALHLVCDFILESGTPVTSSVFDQIDRLHTAMGIDDGCIEQLRNRKLELS